MAARTPRKSTSRYKVSNWAKYEAGLVRRGSITFWFSEATIAVGTLIFPRPIINYQRL